jgi:hypothetical protein
MNYDQLTGIARAVGPALIGWAAGKGWIPPGDATGDIAAAAIALGAAVWSYFNNKSGKTID